jgi:hypothetical protein
VEGISYNTLPRNVSASGLQSQTGGGRRASVGTRALISFVRSENADRYATTVRIHEPAMGTRKEQKKVDKCPVQSQFKTTLKEAPTQIFGSENP